MPLSREEKGVGGATPTAQRCAIHSLPFVPGWSCPTAEGWSGRPCPWGSCAGCPESPHALLQTSWGICSIIFPGPAEAEESVHMASWGDGETCRVLQHSFQGSILPVVSCSRLKTVAALGDAAVGLNNSTGSESKPVSPWRMAPRFQAMGMLLRSSCLTREYSQRISLASALRRMWLSWDMWLPGDALTVVAMMDISRPCVLVPAGSPGPEYQDGRGQSSMETSKVLHEILRELRMILGGVKSLSLNSAVSRRSTNTGDSGADPNAVDNRANPDAVVGKADTGAVDANSFQKYCIEGIVAVLGSMLLGMVLCCVLHVWRKRRKKT
ncbi:uncharacterized protein LOC117007884 isoform X1 [Catharus ustulatus]|uniref:uncharacterized protein LOC117007884 isoform X1 n=2 Tax=Catharus ustulatus TaxID=91951 RepID=UPI00140D1B4B|nr:uncharacterized protein LOC117007884 isoform X1 [Catharus ustulatus]